MGQHQSKTGRHRKSSNNNRARHFPSTPSSSSLALNSSSAPQQPPKPRPLRSQQLQQQRQQQFQHTRSSNHYHNSSHASQQSSVCCSILEQQQERLSSSPYSNQQPSTISISQPILIEDDEESSYGLRLSIDFYSNDNTSNSANSIKNHIMEESRLTTINDDRLSYSDLREYIPPTLSSSSSSTASLGTAMFSTISSPSSMSSAAPSIYSNKFTSVQQQPALIHVQHQQQHQHQQHRRSSIISNVTQTTTDKKSTGTSSLITAPRSTSSLLLSSSSATSITAATDTSSSLVTCANDQSTSVSQASRNEQDQRYRDLRKLVKSQQIEAYYPFAIFQYYGMTPTGKPNYAKAFTLFQATALAYRRLLEDQPSHLQHEQIRGIVSSSQYYLGEMLLTGKKGIFKDEMKAIKYFTSAANNSYFPAQYMIGYYHQHGIADYKVNLQAAYEWYSAAAAQGYSKAQAAVSRLLFKQINDKNNEVIFDNLSRNELIQKALLLLESAVEKVKDAVHFFSCFLFIYFID